MLNINYNKLVVLKTFIILLLISTKLFASNDSLKTERNYKKIYFYSAGWQRGGNAMECRDIQAAKMGFGYKRKAGCVVGPIKYARIHTHNRKVESKLKKRFDDNWHEQYEKLLVDCNKK